MKEYTFLNGLHIKVPQSTCRGCYLENMQCLPEELQPIWSNKDFIVRQDAECPVPGFYIISTRKHIQLISDFSIKQAQELGILIYKIRFYMKEILKINRVEIILEERKVNPHFHIWLLPLWEDIIDKYEIDPKVWNSNILQYIQLFEYNTKIKKAILQYNSQMRNILQKDGELNELVEY